MATVTPKLAVDVEVLAQAKKAYAKRCGMSAAIDPTDIHIAQTISAACELYLPHILNCLDDAGLKLSKPHKDLKSDRPRRVDEKLWEDLKDQTEIYDVSRVGLVRAALALMAAELDTPKEKAKKKFKK